MIAIARHKLIDLWRRRGRDADSCLARRTRGPRSAVVRRSRGTRGARDLGVLLRSISPAQREAIVLTKIEGLTVAEVSVRTGAKAWRR